MISVINRIGRFLFACLLTVITVAGLQSCLDEEVIDDPYADVPEGLPASVSVKVSVPGMNPMTRAAGIDPDGVMARNVNDIWVGVFNVRTGKKTGEAYLDNRNSNEYHTEYTVGNMEVTSGTSYIVGVANLAGNSVVNVETGRTTDLKTALQSLDNWADFKKLAYYLDTPQSTQRLSVLVMSGIYLSEKDHDDSAVPFVNKFVSTDDNPASPVAIMPGQNNLGGMIHLRRLSSYVRFNLKAADYITFTPSSWQVYNIPSTAFLNERSDNTSTGLKNAADTGLDLYGDNHNYHSSLVNEAGTFVGSNSNYYFDFYQLENKHVGLPSMQTYNDREKEHKDGGLNTGWYSSLVAAPGAANPAVPAYDGALANNNASFVVVKGKVQYYFDPADPDFAPVDPTTPGALRRTADVTYTIHLGYCEGGTEDARIRDFNCRRNTKYTYNVTIEGADKIRVEATKIADDPQSGVEGIITDVASRIYNVDSHYAVVNIRLTEQQRRDLVWRIQAPFNGEYVDMVYGPTEIFSDNSTIINLKSDPGKLAALPNNQFYNWVQIRPTSGENIIAPYPGDARLKGRTIRNDDPQSPGTNYNTSGIPAHGQPNAVWYLAELCDPDNYPNNYGSDWYTVFIDEYVYEYELNRNRDDLTGNGNINSLMPLSRWGTYVNQPNRNVWIALTNMNISNDLESIYSSATYLITQESIQTYYRSEATTAIGIECTNESFRRIYATTNNETMTWENYASAANPYSNSDGLLNQYNYVVSQNKRWDNPNTFRNTFRKGSSHIKDIYFDEEYFIPDHEDTYMTACLARNRDLNNDGIIGANEIRWYLPTDETYTRMVLGGSSLRSPLFNLNEYEHNSMNGGTGKPYSHYAGSNARMTWAEEFTATGPINTYSTSGTLRCIRNIGQAMNLSPNDGADGYKPVDQAYSINTATREISLLYYKPEALREYTPTFLPAHLLSEAYSLAYSKFKYAAADCNPTNTPREYQNGPVALTAANGDVPWANADTWIASLAVNGICRAYSEEPGGTDRGTWRVPNITEVAIMMLLKVEGFSSEAHVSCSRENFWRDGNANVFNFMGNNTNPDITAGIGSPTKVRCVKDVRN